MHLTSPAFLFLFLPLSLLYIPFCPPKRRKAVLSLFSIAWFFLANLSHPLSLIQIGFLLFVVSALSMLPEEISPRFRLFLGIGVPLATFLTARILAEYAPDQYTYPFGLGLVTLGAISLSIDRYRGDAPERDTPLDTLGYLLFFPTLTVGPILRYKQYLYMTEHIRPSYAAFSAGAIRYMIGFLKRVSVASVLSACLFPLLRADDAIFSLPMLIFVLLLSFFFLYFIISGTTDMARGLLQIYGLTPPRGQGQVFTSAAPHRMLSHVLLSLDRFIEDYVASPLRHKYGPKTGHVLSCLAFFLCTLLFYRTNFAFLLFGLPLLFTALLFTRHGRWKRTVKNRYVRPLLSLLSACLLSFTTLAMMLDDPMRLFSILGSVFSQNGHPLIYQVLATLTYGRYLLWVLPIALACIPLVRLFAVLSHRLPTRVRAGLAAGGTLLCFLAFFFALVFFYPQFPGYAEMTYRYFAS